MIKETTNLKTIKKIASLKAETYQTWFDVGHYIFTNLQLNNSIVEIAIEKDKNKVFVNYDQLMNFNHSIYESQELNKNNKVSIPVFLQKHCIKILEINKKQRFVEFKYLSDYSKPRHFYNEIQFANRKEFSFNMRLRIVIDAYKSLPKMTIKTKKERNAEYIKFNKVNIHYTRINNQHFFKFVELTKAIGYKSTPYDTFSEFINYSIIGGEKTRSISFENIFKMIEKTTHSKEKNIKELLNKIIKIFFPTKNLDLIIDRENSFIISNFSVIPFIREYESILFQTRSILKLIDCNRTGGLQGSIKNLSILNEDDGCYYIDIHDLPLLANTFMNQNYKNKLNDFIKLTNKFKK